MLHRLRWFGAGTALGIGASVWAQRKLKAAAARYRPAGLAGTALDKARSWPAHVRAAFDEGRSTMREREAALRQGSNKPRAAEPNPPGRRAESAPPPSRTPGPPSRDRRPPNRDHGPLSRTPRPPVTSPPHAESSLAAVSNLDAEMDANALRRVFTQFFVDRGHTAVSLGGPDPARPAGAPFYQCRDEPVHPVLPGRGTTPLPDRAPAFKSACGSAASTTTSTSSGGPPATSRSSRCSATSASVTISRNGPSPSPGSSSPGPSAWTATACGSASSSTTTRRPRSGRDRVGVPAGRIQRMGDDNFWEMGETGPCGPCSEIYYDRGPDWGPAGGPAGGGGEERYVELWNLVFMQYDRQPDATLVHLPRPNIDTGAGLERVLTVVQDVPSVWETDAPSPDHRPGRGAHGADLRRGRRGRRGAPNPGRSRPVAVVPHQRRRVPEQ